MAKAKTKVKKDKKPKQGKLRFTLYDKREGDDELCLIGTLRPPKGNRDSSVALEAKLRELWDAWRSTVQARHSGSSAFLTWLCSAHGWRPVESDILIVLK